MMLEDEKRACLQAVRDAYPGQVVQEFQEQGQCSYTILVYSQEYSPGRKYVDQTGIPDDDEPVYRPSCESRIVQVRPAQYALELSIAQAARNLYPSLAPAIRSLDLELPGNMHAYEMERLSGVPLCRILPRGEVIDAELQAKQPTLIKSFAAFIAHGYHSRAQVPSKSRNTRADSPMDNDSEMLSQCTGRVGTSIISRLEKLAMYLPDEWLRRKAKDILTFIATLDDYPVVLNHGDLISSNILVDECTWEITGLVDWVEAEYLPFGTCLYGLELLLGYITPSLSPGTTLDRTKDGVFAFNFTYYHNATVLRKIFWTSLLKAVPELDGREEDVRMMRDMGVLLWYGFAWDGGAIDRVVNEKNDVEELAYLRAFLNVD